MIFSCDVTSWLSWYTHITLGGTPSSWAMSLTSLPLIVLWGVIIFQYGLPINAIHISQFLLRWSVMLLNGWIVGVLRSSPLGTLRRSVCEVNGGVGICCNRVWLSLLCQSQTSCSASSASYSTWFLLWEPSRRMTMVLGPDLTNSSCVSSSWLSSSGGIFSLQSLPLSLEFFSVILPRGCVRIV